MGSAKILSFVKAVALKIYFTNKIQLDCKGECVRLEIL